MHCPSKLLAGKPLVATVHAGGVVVYDEFRPRIPGTLAIALYMVAMQSTIGDYGFIDVDPVRAQRGRELLDHYAVGMGYWLGRLVQDDLLRRRWSLTQTSGAAIYWK
jgi:hypothetical protein